VLDRDAFVQRPGREVAGPEAGQHGVDIGQAGPLIGRRGHRDVVTTLDSELLGNAPHGLQPVGVFVDEHDLGAGELRTVPQQRGHGAGCP